MQNDKSFLASFFQKNSKFEKYFEILIEWNQRINLTAIVDRDEVFKKHFLDSVLCEYLIEKGASVLDIGSGAGFPALPLAILRDDANFLLIETVGKKIKFLNEVIDVLKIGNARALNMRIEDLKKVEGSKFDYVTAKAVAKLNILAEYALPYLKIGGRLIAYKSSNVDEELIEAKSAIKIMGGILDDVIEMDLDEDIKRKFVVIKKIAECDKKYPRDGNKPRLKPL